jgi:hypothetical protein
VSWLLPAILLGLLLREKRKSRDLLLAQAGLLEERESWMGEKRAGREQEARWN